MLLVMDYMEGGPVMTREALERGRCIPEPLALQYFRDMCKVRTAPGTRSPAALPCICTPQGLQTGMVGEIQLTAGCFSLTRPRQGWYQLPAWNPMIRDGTDSAAGSMQTL